MSSAASHLVIGLTGGVCSGKSSAARYLATLGAVTIDADKLGHRAYCIGSRGHRRVVSAFGKKVVNKETGEIDRRILGGLVFNNNEAMKKLTSIVWPIIRKLAHDEIEEAKRKHDSAIIIVEAAVAVEANWLSLFDEIWVTFVPKAVARQRLMERNQLDEEVN